MAPASLDIEKTFDTIWHSGLLYKLSDYSTTPIKLISFFLTNRKFKILVTGKFSTLLKIAAGVPQGSLFSKILYNLYIHDAIAGPGTHLALLADDTCTYATEKHEYGVFFKLQRSLTAMNMWCEARNIKTNEGKTQEIY
jgi:hypothetical protein